MTPEERGTPESMTHHQRKHSTPIKRDLFRRPDSPFITTGEMSLPKKTPAKKPRGYCVKLKGPHVFVIQPEQTWEDTVRYRDCQGRVSSYQWRREFYACSGCGKKQIRSYKDGVYTGKY